MSGTREIESPIENREAMCHTERCHGPLCKTYVNLKSEMKGENPDKCFQTAVYCLNNTLEPEDLCESLFVFRSIPQTIRENPATDQVKQEKAVEEAMDMKLKYLAMIKE